MRKKLSTADYRMADAAEELAGMRSSEWRRRYNKALSEYYRALSVRDSVGAESRLGKNKRSDQV